MENNADNEKKGIARGVWIFKWVEIGISKMIQMKNSTIRYLKEVQKIFCIRITNVIYWNVI